MCLIANRPATYFMNIRVHAELLASQAVKAIVYRIIRKEKDSMANKNIAEKPSMWERTEYDVISETETDSELIGIIGNRYNGAKIICRIPKYTSQEEEQLSADITYSLIQIDLTGQDISPIKNMEVLIE